MISWNWNPKIHGLLSLLHEKSDQMDDLEVTPFKRKPPNGNFTKKQSDLVARLVVSTWKYMFIYIYIIWVSQLGWNEIPNWLMKNDPKHQPVIEVGMWLKCPDATSERLWSIRIEALWEYHGTHKLREYSGMLMECENENITWHRGYSE